MGVIGNFQFEGGLPFPSGAAAALYTSPIESPETVVAGTSVDTALVQLWKHSIHTSWANSVAVDLQGNIYTAGADGTVKRTNQAGEVIWSYTASTGYDAYSTVVDMQNNVYCTTTSQYDGYAIKLDGDGNLLWKLTESGNSTTPGVSVGGISTDVQGNAYFSTTGPASSKPYKLLKVNSAGSQVWLFTGSGGYISRAAVDLWGNAFVCVEGNTDPVKVYIYKLDSNGSPAWTFDVDTERVDSLAVDLQGNVYSCTTKERIIRKINSEGDLVWSFTNYAPSASYISTGHYGKLAVDLQGNVYTNALRWITGGTGWRPVIYKLNSSGVMMWYSIVEADNEDHYGISCLALDLQGNIYASRNDSGSSVNKLFDGYVIHTT